MRPFGQPLFSKGILAKIKAWGLATKGMLDEIAKKGHSSEEVKRFSAIYKIEGKKEKILLLDIPIKGLKLFNLANNLLLIGIKEIGLVSNYITEGTKSFLVETSNLITGSKIVERTIDYTCSAVKEFKLESSALVRGIKKYSFSHGNFIKSALVDLKYNLLGKKTSEVLEIAKIKASRFKPVSLVYSVCGRRDITEILAALNPIS